MIPPLLRERLEGFSGTLLEFCSEGRIHSLSRKNDSPAWQPDLRSGFLIGGRFELLDQIGEGATSTVYKVRDSANHRIVALKVLKESAARHPRFAECFHRELNIGRQLNHPNVVRIYDAGQHENWLYLVMEYINGRTLCDLLRMTPRFPLDDFETLYRQLLAALQCVHSLGLVHRDIKPGNLMLSSSGEWKLMDFGIAREMGAMATTGATMGTPDYMSPERLLGKPATSTSDIYAAGALFFEVLTGTVPFQTMQPMQRCTQPAPSLQERRPDVPGWLHLLVSRCLAPRAEDRHQSVDAILAGTGSFAPAAPLPADPIDAPEAVQPPQVMRTLTESYGPAPGDLQSALSLMLELLRRLEEMESAGLAHEPLSPYTVFLTSAGMLEVASRPHSARRDTLIVTNPKYAAPELLLGRNPEDAGGLQRADLYILAFLIYEYLIGQDLFHRQFAQVEERGAELGWMQWHSDPAARARPLAEVLPQAPALLSSLLAAMLEKDPAKRPADYVDTIQSVQDIMRRTRSTQQILLPRDPAPARPVSGRRMKEKWITVVAAAGTLLLLSAVLAAMRHFHLGGL